MNKTLTVKIERLHFPFKYVVNVSIIRNFSTLFSDSLIESNDYKVGLDINEYKNGKFRCYECSRFISKFNSNYLEIVSFPIKSFISEKTLRLSIFISDLCIIKNESKTKLENTIRSFVSKCVIFYNFLNDYSCIKFLNYLLNESKYLVFNDEKVFNKKYELKKYILSVIKGVDKELYLKFLRRWKNEEGNTYWQRFCDFKSWW